MTKLLQLILLLPLLAQADMRGLLLIGTGVGWYHQ